MKPAATTRGLFWFTEDLRTHDHALLARATAECGELVCVYVMQSWQFSPKWTVQPGMGHQRLRFLLESLADLDEQLFRSGLRLEVHQANAIDVLQNICRALHINAVYRSASSGYFEQQQWLQLQQQLPEVAFHTTHTRSLYLAEQLPFALQDLPASFTPFRKHLEQAAPQVSQANRVNSCQALLSEHQPARVADWRDWLSSPLLAIDPQGFNGGSQAGQNQLDGYFSSPAPASYKQTRNALSGWSMATRFSPWLALGCVSPGQVWRQLKDFEQCVVANESTYWICFELLWREYFYWYGMRHGSRLFCQRGVKNAINIRPDETQAFDRFHSWCTGRTGQPLVDACMRQLNHSGYMSNRGRQLVASFLIHELAVDWRWGASYFEQQLMDYEVGSNWGNWQYIAGVGADPRGGRHFNVEKQQQMFDPDGEFIATWPDVGEVVVLNPEDLG